MTLEGNSSQVMTLNYESRIKRGVRKGDALACFLCNIAMEKVVMDAGIQMVGTTCYKPVQILAYVYDIVVGIILPTMKASFEVLDKTATKMGLLMKIRIMCMVANHQRAPALQKVTILKCAFECVDHFVYIFWFIHDK